MSGTSGAAVKTSCAKNPRDVSHGDGLAKKKRHAVAGEGSVKKTHGEKTRLVGGDEGEEMWADKNQHNKTEVLGVP